MLVFLEFLSTNGLAGNTEISSSSAEEPAEYLANKLVKTPVPCGGPLLSPYTSLCPLICLIYVSPSCVYSIAEIQFRSVLVVTTHSVTLLLLPSPKI